MISERAQRAIDWIEQYCWYAGKRITLLPHQRADLIKILRSTDEGPPVRRAILSYGRKNGKTFFCALLVLLFLIGPEAAPDTEIYSAARSRDQAAIVFKFAAAIVRSSPDIADHVGIRDTVKELYVHSMRTLYKALSADAKTKLGLGPRLVIHDELGQVSGPDDALYDALETAMMAQAEPISIIISTQAATDEDLLSVLIDDAASDESTILSLYTAPIDLEQGNPEKGIPADKEYPFTTAALRAANPAYGITQNETELLRLADEAKRLPSKENVYRNLILNQRVETKGVFVTRSLWDPLAAEIPMPAPGSAVYLGLDLSEVVDLTALVLVWELDEVIHCKPAFWLPNENPSLRARSMRDKVPYDVWHRRGHLKVTDGPSIDYDDIIPHVTEIFDTYKVLAAGFDKYNWKHFERALKRHCKAKGIRADKIIDAFCQIGQGTREMSPALRTLETAIINGKFRHDNNPVMNMCVTNAVVSSADTSNRRLIKRSRYRRIDGMTALATAVAAMAVEQTRPDKNPARIRIA